VRNLERHLDTTLIHRDTRRVSLTDEGVLYLDKARDILRAVEDADSELQTHAGEIKGSLEVELPISVGSDDGVKAPFLRDACLDMAEDLRRGRGMAREGRER
jgi:DNA-binding transcriptional LysR family regulator